MNDFGDLEKIGLDIYEFAELLWPMNRSITGEGVRETLASIHAMLPDLEVSEISSGKSVFDWVVPDEWQINDAWIICPDGTKICDFRENNLHVLGYSAGVDLKIDLEDLQSHLYSLPDQPNAIPYTTSYYKKRWGFCLSHVLREKLAPGTYHVYIDATHFKGSLSYAEAYYPGKSEKEIFLSTYICHPSMANNEISGIAVTTFAAMLIASMKNRKYSYRIVFLPETIGSICYIKENIDALQKNVIAGFNLTCIGDERNYSFLSTRHGDTLSDRVGRHVVKNICPNPRIFDWLDRGSDERQYCSPGVDLPIASLMRTKYGEYDEYHTSLDTLGAVVTPRGLAGGLNMVQKCIELLENNVLPKTTVLCEPNMGKRGLYPTVSQNGVDKEVQLMMDIISYSDGTNSLLDIAEKCSKPAWEVLPIVKVLNENGILGI